jgi:tetratricopeptide (TPR) repeat protein
LQKVPETQLPADKSKPITLILYVNDGSSSGPIIPGAAITGQDGSGNSFEQTTGNHGSVMITGNPGAWSFSVSAAGYETKNWSQLIDASCARHAFLHQQAVQKPESSALSNTQNSEICPETCNGYSNNCLALLNDPNEAFECYQSAAKCFENAVQQNPNNARCWYNLGSALHNSGNRLQDIRHQYDDANQISQFEEAIRALDRATELDPHLKYAWNEKGVIYKQLGNLGEAIKCFDKAIEIDPSWSVPRGNKGESGNF